MGSTERQRAVPRFFIVTLSLCFFGSSQAAPVPAAPVPAGDNKTPSVGAGPTQMSAAPRQLETISVTGVAIPGNPLSQAANESREVGVESWMPPARNPISQLLVLLPAK